MVIFDQNQFLKTSPPDVFAIDLPCAVVLASNLRMNAIDSIQDGWYPQIWTVVRIAGNLFLTYRINVLTALCMKGVSLKLFSYMGPFRKFRKKR